MSSASIQLLIRQKEADLLQKNNELKKLLEEEIGVENFATDVNKRETRFAESLTYKKQKVASLSSLFEISKSAERYAEKTRTYFEGEECEKAWGNIYSIKESAKKVLRKLNDQIEELTLQISILKNEISSLISEYSAAVEAERRAAEEWAAKEAAKNAKR